MRDEILINITPQETRASIVENGVLQELHIERTENRGIVGNIYKGVVKRVMPGMQAAFVDIGHEKAAFLHLADIVTDKAEGSKQAIEGAQLLDKQQAQETDITSVLHEGQKITVQVIKDPISSKGARLTTHITIPSRYLVLMPDTEHVGVSQRIDDEHERVRLRELLEEHEDLDNGFIIRTAAEGASEKELVRDALFLAKLWKGVTEKSKQVKAPGLIHEDLSLELRIMRDIFEDDVERVRIDDQTTLDRIIKFVQKFLPDMESRIELYESERPIFDLYNVEEEIKKALERKVQLKSGGYLIIDQTEAMTTVDVNTGAFVGHKNLEETIFRTNLEAATALARQLRLRNLGGIIIVDFIDMKEEEHKRQVLRTLERLLEKDHVKTQITEVSSLGLVEMTRKRSRESLERLLCEPCQQCNGRGYVKTAVTVCYEIFRELSRAARTYDVQKFLVLASQEVVDCLLDEEASSLGDLEVEIDKPIKLQVESLYSPEQFDVVLM
ncbi:ribonuclease G [Kangiella geojedonensis]|uniref:Ribonuclease G n=1 Tax=Kangiella geojedonensis TaxID=914150 RepID=A0A0F6RD84_9GAMM|nr:ribonuclease G [Kangiella geojedonensis]AKE52691.1 ribonuclease G [Kangiella geojedonensis]